MKTQARTSLGEQISKKMSAWVLILVAVITAGIFFVSYLLSNQMFNKQVNIWNTLAPQYALTNLIDSDYSSIKREIKFLESTGLFSSFKIADNQKNIIAEFGDDTSEFYPIQDQAKIIWGYYSFKPNFYKFFSPFLVAGGIFSALVLFLYFVVRGRMRSGLELEFSKFNQFLSEIELVTEKLGEIYNECSEDFSVNQSSYSAEQEIINRAVSKLLEEIKKSNRSLREAISESVKQQFQGELTRSALQVAHDIGSPLAALESIVQSTSIALPEKSRIAIRNAASRIRDITNTLLTTAKQGLDSKNDELLTQHLLYSLINMIVTEKRLEFREKTNIEILFEVAESSYGLFSILRITDFNRVLSNLINNSVDALSSGQIVVTLASIDNDVVITVKDNGAGIPKEILSKIGKFGVSYGKTGGLGLGLYHAKNTIESWGGKFEIESELGAGTTNKIYLPRSQVPFWFVSEIKIADKQNIAIIDDDKSIHDIWVERFKNFQNKMGISINMYHFYSPSEFIAWHEDRHKKNDSILYLCDHEFIGSQETGIDLVTRLKINYLSILVTSRVNCDEILSQCEALGIKLLPKDIANFVPFSV